MIACPRDAAACLSVEDAALCATWLEFQEERPEIQPLKAEIPRVVEHWLVTFAGEPAAPGGVRHQPLLRALITELELGNRDNLLRDELGFLCIAYDLMRRSPRADSFARPASYLAPHMESIRALCESRPPAPGLPNLQRRVDVVVEDDLLAAPQRKLNVFAGLQMPVTGHVLARWGPLRVFGDIPEQCIVAVDEGECYVNGYVIGHVAATRGCDIMQNVSGVAIARKGDVRLRDIIERAVVISKHGCIRCRAARGAQLVYAHLELSVKEALTTGLYLSPRITVGGRVRGGTLHISELASAERFSPLGDKPLEIVLRRSLSHEDYGEQISREAVRLLLQAYAHRRRAREVRELMAFAKRESEHYARNALLYLAGGEKISAQLEDLQAAERRLAFLDRIIAGIDTMIQAVDDRRDARKSDGVREAAAKADDAALEALRKELEELEQEGGVDSELAGKREEILRLHRELREKDNEIGEALHALTLLWERASVWLRERHVLAEATERAREAVQNRVGRVALLDKINAEFTASKALQQVLAAAKDQAASSALGVRLRQPFARLMIHNMENRSNRLKTLAVELHRAGRDYQETVQKLLTEHQIQLPAALRPDEPAGGTVHGCFDAGVRIYADMRAFEARTSGGAGVLVTQDEERPVTFSRGQAGSVVRS